MRNDLPETCLSTLPGEGKLVVLKRGETGYYPSDWGTGSKAENKKIAEWHNHQCGISPAQAMAMQAGSMFGFDIPGADPQWYYDEAKFIATYPLGISAILYADDSLCENVTGCVHEYQIAGETLNSPPSPEV